MSWVEHNIMGFALTAAMLWGWVIGPVQVEAQWLSLHHGLAQNYVRTTAVNKLDGRILVVGKIRYPVSLENGVVLSPRANNCCNEVAIYGAIYSQDGELHSARIIEDHSPNTGQPAYGGSPAIIVGDVKWLPDGDYLLAGYFVGAGNASSYITLGTRPNHIELASDNRAAKTFVARFTSDHDLVWAKEIRYIPGGAGRYLRMALAPDGGIYVTGWPLLVKLNQLGDKEWDFYHTADGNAYSVLADESRVCVAGEKGEGAAITCLSHAGEVIDEITIREVPDNVRKVQVLDMTLDGDTLFIAGYATAGVLDYQMGSSSIEGFTEETEYFVGAIDGDLDAVQWAVALPTLRYWDRKSAHSIPRVDSCGDGLLYVTGTFNRAWEHAIAEPEAFSEQRPGSFFLKMNRSGQVLGATSIRSVGGDIWVNGVDCIGSSELVVAGEFRWEMNFNRFGTEPLIRYAPELEDGFLMRWSFAGEAFPVNLDEAVALPDEHLIEIYPNPASKYVTIELPATPGRGASATIYDILGRRVVASTLHPSGARHVWTPDILGLNSGVYFLRFVIDGRVLTQRFTVIR